MGNRGGTRAAQGKTTRLLVDDTVSADQRDWVSSMRRCYVRDNVRWGSMERVRTEHTSKEDHPKIESAEPLLWAAEVPVLPRQTAHHIWKYIYMAYGVTGQDGLRQSISMLYALVPIACAGRQAMSLEEP